MICHLQKIETWEQGLPALKIYEQEDMPLSLLILCFNRKVEVSRSRRNTLKPAEVFLKYFSLKLELGPRIRNLR